MTIDNEVLIDVLDCSQCPEWSDPRACYRCADGDIPVKVCEHDNTVLDVRGGHHYAAGEVWDDIEESVYCLDCQTVIG